MKKEIKIEIIVDYKKKKNYVNQIILIALEKLPDEVARFFSKTPIIFTVETIASNDIIDAHTFSLQAFRNKKAFIHLYPHVWRYSEKKIIKIIHHELAHIFLGHTKKIIKSFKEESRNERDVERLVKKWSNC